ELVQVDFVAFVSPCPAENSEVRDGNDVGKEFVCREATVHDAVQSTGLLRETFEAVASVLLVIDLEEMVHLPRDGAEAAHLKHQPLKNGYARACVLGPELARLLAKIDKNGTGFEHADGRAVRAVAINDRRDLVVRTDL